MTLFKSGTDQGKQHSWDYNAKQREGTVQLAMVEQLQHPPDGFEDVVKGHFYYRRRWGLQRYGEGGIVFHMQKLKNIYLYWRNVETRTRGV